MTDYFAQQALPHTETLILPHTETLIQPSTELLSSNSNNALSIWNPSYNTPSPNTLLASLFGSQPVDPFPTASIFDMNPSLGQQYDPSYDFTTNVSKLDNVSGDMDHHQFFKLPSMWERTPPDGITARQDTTNTMLDPLAPIESLGSSESTPISLNGNTAYNSNFASYVQPEYRNRPEHPAYLYQLQMLDNPDQLAPYFPSLEQRHQVCRTSP